jgi:hypothetical protein
MCALPNSLWCRAYSALQQKIPCPTVLVPYKFILTSLNSTQTHPAFTQLIQTSLNSYLAQQFGAVPIVLHLVLEVAPRLQRPTLY